MSLDEDDYLLILHRKIAKCWEKEYINSAVVGGNVRKRKMVRVTIGGEVGAYEEQVYVVLFCESGGFRFFFI